MHRPAVDLTGMAGELMRRGHATAQQRAAAGQGAALFCRREHHAAIARGGAIPGVPCCPHCTLYPAGGRRG